MKTWTRQLEDEETMSWWGAAVRFPSSLESALAQLLCPQLVRERSTLQSYWLALILALATLLIHHSDFQ